jgi:hypothetical protein
MYVLNIKYRTKRSRFPTPRVHSLIDVVKSKLIDTKSTKTLDETTETQREYIVERFFFLQ